MGGPSSPSSRTSRRNDKVTAVMSPAPVTARALFGEGARKFLRDPPRPSRDGAFLQIWATGSVKWQQCDACGHSCWAGGRLCQEGEGSFRENFFCRCCWSGWAEAEKEIVPYQYGGWQCSDDFAF